MLNYLLPTWTVKDLDAGTSDCELLAVQSTMAPFSADVAELIVTNPVSVFPEMLAVTCEIVRVGVGFPMAAQLRVPSAPTNKAQV